MTQAVEVKTAMEGLNQKGALMAGETSRSPGAGEPFAKVFGEEMRSSSASRTESRQAERTRNHEAKRNSAAESRLTRNRRAERQGPDRESGLEGTTGTGRTGRSGLTRSPRTRESSQFSQASEETLSGGARGVSQTRQESPAMTGSSSRTDVVEDPAPGDPGLMEVEEELDGQEILEAPEGQESHVPVLAASMLLENEPGVPTFLPAGEANSPLDLDGEVDLEIATLEMEGAGEFEEDTETPLPASEEDESSEDSPEILTFTGDESDVEGDGEDPSPGFGDGKSTDQKRNQLPEPFLAAGPMGSPVNGNRGPRSQSPAALFQGMAPGQSYPLISSGAAVAASGADQARRGDLLPSGLTLGPPTGTTGRAAESEVPRTAPPTAPLELGEARDRWVSRLSAAIRSQIRTGASELQLHLRPPRLGQLNLKISMVGSTLEVSMDVESNAVRHLLNAGVGELRESLRDAGLEMKEFHIHVENHEEHQAAEGDGQYGSEGDPEEGSGDKEAGEDMEPETSEESGDTSERAIDFQA